VLLPLMLLVLLPELVLGVSLRTCFVTLSQIRLLPKRTGSQGPALDPRRSA